MSDTELPWDDEDLGWLSEPYQPEEDQGYGTCPECGTYLINGGAASEGDGDIGDELICPLCQEARGWFNRRWYDEDGKWIPEP